MKRIAIMVLLGGLLGTAPSYGAPAPSEFGGYGPVPPGQDEPPAEPQMVVRWELEALSQTPVARWQKHFLGGGPGGLVFAKPSPYVIPHCSDPWTSEEEPCN